MVCNEKEIGSQKYSERGVGNPFIEMMAQTTTQSTKESTSDVKNSFNTIPLVVGRQSPMHVVIISAHAAISEELLMTSVPFPFIAQQDDVPDTDAPLSLQPSMCVCDPLVEMMVRTPTQSTIIMENSSEIEIPSERPSYHFIHLTLQGFLAASASKLSDGELFKTPFTSCQAYGFVSPVNPVLPYDVTIISLTLSM